MTAKLRNAAPAVGQMLFGTVFMAAAFGLVILPQGMAAGGVTGFCRVLSAVLPLPVATLVLMGNLLLLLLGLLFAGWQFVAKTVFVSVVFPILLEAASRFPCNAIAGNPLLSILLAGAMLGVGAGLVLKSGASSGGFDVLSVIFNRRAGIPVALTMNLFDCTVILMQAVGQPLSKTVQGMAVIAISSFLVGRLAETAAPPRATSVQPDSIRAAA